VTHWSEDEVHDARRDVAALLRAGLHGAQDDIGAILDGAGDRATRCIAETLLGTAAEMTGMLAVALGVIGEGPQLDAILSTGLAEIMAEPELRALVDGILATTQAAIIKGG
jgi:hypothetical protein